MNLEFLLKGENSRMAVNATVLMEEKQVAYRFRLCWDIKLISSFFIGLHICFLAHSYVRKIVFHTYDFIIKKSKIIIKTKCYLQISI